MARRGENIYKRKDGRWEGRVMTSEGKYQYVYAKTYMEVKKKKKKLQDYVKPVTKETCKIKAHLSYLNYG